MAFVNLFAFRATEPRNMMQAEDPVGPLNDRAIIFACEWADQIICGRGAHGTHRGRDRAVLDLFKRYQIGELWALATTKEGHPGHPLYLPGGTAPKRWTPALP